jgi:hypothetical protein
MGTPKKVKPRTSREVGPTGQRLAENVKNLKGHRSYRDLSAHLEELGRPIYPSGIVKIEQGERHVDADDLVALALALDVSPNRLLLPADADDQVIELTPSESTTTATAWHWATGEAPLPIVGPPRVFDAERTRRFQRQNRPHVPPFEMSFEDVERLAPLLDPVMAAVRVAVDEGVEVHTILEYVRMLERLRAVANEAVQKLSPPPKKRAAEKKPRAAKKESK